MENQTHLDESAELMNEALLSLYENRLPQLNEQIEQCILECPWDESKVSNLFFMQVDEAYLKAPIRILFVGRETYGWQGQYSKFREAKSIMDSYKASMKQVSIIIRLFGGLEEDSVRK